MVRIILFDFAYKLLGVADKGAWHSLSLFLTTFVFEDVALVMGVAFVKNFDLSFSQAFVSLFLGIALGDLGLYGIGALARKVPKISWPRLESFRKQIRDSKRAGLVIVASRALPGSRLPIYLAAGYFGYSFSRFVVATLLSVFVWVGVTLGFGHALSRIWSGQLWSLIGLFVLTIFFAKRLAPKLLDPWQRKTLWHSWRRWTHFEFWPAWFFYVPIVPYVIFLIIKYRGVRFPLYANPDLRNGGLVGESKWDYLKFLKSGSSWTLKAVPLSRNEDWRADLAKSSLKFPMIFKPDVGQRGYGVRLIRDEAEAGAYLSQMGRGVIAQEYCEWNVEVGIFYQRFPDQSLGVIPSITRKEFPFVVGDGKMKLGDLIVSNLRARIIAGVYFERFENELDRVPADGEKVALTLSGNHCQGAIFWDGRELISPELQSAIDKLAHEIPNFYFGRIDIRARSLDDLKVGKNFVVIEVNGSGSEMTHIWDANGSLFSAYKTLFQQWDLLFQTGHRVWEMGISSDTGKLPDLIADVKLLFKKNKNLNIAS